MITKQLILETCKELILKRISTAEYAMKAAQESSNSEDKSSAGDKYETARAMGQLDRDMNAKQLVQAKQELIELNKIDLQPSNKVKIGSLVQTSQSLYFIAVGLGNVQIKNEMIVIISPRSPLAMAMMGCGEHDTFMFNQKQFIITKLS